MDFGQLLRGKFIIETMEVNDLILGTKRTTVGSLPKKREAAPGSGESSFTQLAKQALQKSVEKTPLFDFDVLRRGINTDSLIRSLDLQTIARIDSLRSRVLAASQQWQASLSDIETSRQKLEGVEAQLKAINPSGLKSLDKITGAITTVDQSLKTVNDVRGTIEARTASVRNDIATVGATAGTIDDAVSGDYRKLLSMAKLPDLNASGLADLLIGKQMMADVQKYLYWIDFARQNIPKYTPKPDYEKPPRFKGQDIRFPEEHSYPKLWIKKTLVSGGTDKAQDPDYLYAKGEALNIASDQRLTGAPMTIALEGTRARRAVTLRGLFDRRKEEPYDEYSATLKGVPMSDMQLGRSDFLPSKITSAQVSTAVAVTVPGRHFDAHVDLAFAGMHVVFERETRGMFERMARDVLQSVSGFDVGLRIWNSAGPVQVAFRTDLDDQIARRIRDVVGAELTRLQNELRAKLNAFIAGKRQEFEKLYAAKKAEVDAKLKSAEDLVNATRATVDAKKKELTDRLEQEKKGKTEDLLKGLMKKK